MLKQQSSKILKEYKDEFLYLRIRMIEYLSNDKKSIERSKLVLELFYSDNLTDLEKKVPQRKLYSIDVLSFTKESFFLYNTIFKECVLFYLLEKTDKNSLITSIKEKLPKYILEKEIDFINNASVINKIATIYYDKKQFHNSFKTFLL